MPQLLNVPPASILACVYIPEIDIVVDLDVLYTSTNFDAAYGNALSRYFHRRSLPKITPDACSIYPPYAYSAPPLADFPILYKFKRIIPITYQPPPWTLNATNLAQLSEYDSGLQYHYTDGTPLYLFRIMYSFMKIMTEEQKMEEGKKMFSIFAARMFEQRVLQAYREKVAQERQLQLLRELEDEDKLTKEREQKKQNANQKKKDKKRYVKLS